MKTIEKPLEASGPEAQGRRSSAFICRFHGFCVFDETSISISGSMSMLHIDIGVKHRHRCFTSISMVKYRTRKLKNEWKETRIFWQSKTEAKKAAPERAKNPWTELLGRQGRECRTLLPLGGGLGGPAPPADGRAYLAKKRRFSLFSIRRFAPKPSAPSAPSAALRAGEGPPARNVPRAPPFFDLLFSKIIPISFDSFI